MGACEVVSGKKKKRGKLILSEAGIPLLIFELLSRKLTYCIILFGFSCNSSTGRGKASIFVCSVAWVKLLPVF